MQTFPSWLKSFSSKFENSNLHHAYLISGRKGVGKSLLANQLAMQVLCDTKEDILSDKYQSSNLSELENHPDFHTLRILPDKKLIGIITDGDLRRVLQKKIDIYTLKASDISGQTLGSATDGGSVSGGRIIIEHGHVDGGVPHNEGDPLVINRYQEKGSTNFAVMESGNTGDEGDKISTEDLGDVLVQEDNDKILFEEDITHDNIVLNGTDSSSTDAGDNILLEDSGETNFDNAGSKLITDSLEETPDLFKSPDDQIILEPDTFSTVGEIHKVTITNSGRGYTDLPTITITSENGSNAKLLATTDDIGAIDSVKVKDPGLDYSESNLPDLTLSLIHI